MKTESVMTRDQKITMKIMRERVRTLYSREGRGGNEAVEVVLGAGSWAVGGLSVEGSLPVVEVVWLG